VNGCPRPDKTRYENQGAVRGAIRRMSKRHKGQGLHPYRCSCGAWHVGRRLRRVTIAWRAEQ